MWEILQNLNPASRVYQFLEECGEGLEHIVLQTGSTLVSRSTTEQSFAVNRQLFLVEQGYKYQIRYFE
jgi:hypothetical protein